MTYLHFLLQCDVNTVCFADESGHIIYSGSDDGLCKVNILFLYFLPKVVVGIELPKTCFLHILPLSICESN